jgi:antitoxin VapB
MVQTPIYRTKDGQTILLPDSVGFPSDVDCVDIVRQGKGLLLTPAGMAWDAFFDSTPVSDDFLSDRNQPPPQDRQNM